MEIRQPFHRRKPPRNRLLARESSASAASTQWWKKGQDWAAPVLLMAIGTLLGLYAFPLIKSHINQPVGRVVVQGDLHYLERREVMAQVPVYQGDRWLDVDLNAVRADIETLPWIYSAQVSRQWPHTITVKLEEQKPIAMWNDQALLNQYGEVFERDGKAVKDLPVLLGGEGSERLVMERFLEISRLLAPLRLRPVRLELDARHAWNVTLDNGVLVKIGSHQTLERMQRFVFLYQQELSRAERGVAVVDLRYGSGAAVQWQSARKTPGEQPVTERVL